MGNCCSWLLGNDNDSENVGFVASAESHGVYQPTRGQTVPPSQESKQKIQEQGKLIASLQEDKKSLDEMVQHFKLGKDQAVSECKQKDDKIRKQGGVIERLKDDNKSLNNQVDKIKSEKKFAENAFKKKLSEITDRLSKEMEAKVAANESDLENVSIKNRPMNVAEQYQLLMSNQWFDAKTTLDECSPNTSEWEKVYLLNRIIVVCEQEPLELFKLFQSQLKQILYCPQVLLGTSEHSLDPKDVAIFVEDEERYILPKQLSNSAGDLLRKEADNVNLEKLLQRVYTTLQKEFENMQECKAMWTAVYQSEALKHYITSLVKIVWKMVIQRPPMKFKHCTTWKGEDVHDRYWSSSESPDAEIFQVYPILYHGDQLMAKGKVYGMLKEKT